MISRNWALLPAHRRRARLPDGRAIVQSLAEALPLGQKSWTPEAEFPEGKTTVNCVICKLGETHPGQLTVTLQRGDTTVVLKGVPAEVCDNRGEHYLSEEVAGAVLAKAEEAVKHGAEVEILRFAA